jgi:hypothetical protein
VTTVSSSRRFRHQQTAFCGLQLHGAPGQLLAQIDPAFFEAQVEQHRQSGAAKPTWKIQVAVRDTEIP